MTQNDPKFSGSDTQSYSAEPLDDREPRSRGETMQARASAQGAAGSVQDALGEVASQAKVAAAKLGEQAKATATKVTEQAKATAAKVSAQAKDAYGRVSDTTHDMVGKVDPMVRDQPYAALGVAAAAGFVLGVMMAGRGSKIVYLKQSS